MLKPIREKETKPRKILPRYMDFDRQIFNAKENFKKIKNITVFAAVVILIVVSLVGLVFLQNNIPDLNINPTVFIPYTLSDKPTPDEIQQANIRIQDQRDVIRQQQDISGKAINSGHLAFAMLCVVLLSCIWELRRPYAPRGGFR